MKILSLIIGVSEYDHPKNNLDNPENDAKDLSEKFTQLGYRVMHLTNPKNVEIDETLYNFGIELNDYDVGIFYFAGHGMQIDGENFLTAKDTNFKSERDAKYTSMSLNKILDTFDSCDNKTSIIILDACRDNPYEKSWNRSVSSLGLAPVNAPKGTLIAYATSPGEKALDGIGRNGLYTSVFLKNLEEINVEIEEFFKRVRNSVYAFSQGKQTTWEHTSLTGTFYFNNGVQLNKIENKYAENVIKDSKYLFVNSYLSNIIKNLKTYNWYVQNVAITQFSKLIYNSSYDKNELFLLGRNFLQTAIGGENLANELISNIENWIDKLNTFENENYFLDGLLFEIYFDSYGIFRDNRLKDTLIKYIYPLQFRDDLEKSFKFIENELLPFSNRYFFCLKFKNKPIHLNLFFEKTVEESEDVYLLREVIFEGNSVLKLDDVTWGLFEGEKEKYQPILRKNLNPKISQLAKIPKEYLKLITNFDYELFDDSKMNIPLGKIIRK